MHRATAKSPVQADSVKENRHVRFYRAPARSMTDTTCTIEGCVRPVRAKKQGWCGAHHQRFLRHGDPLGGGESRAAPGEPWRYYLATVYRPSDGCKVWPYAVANGYGVLAIGRTQYSVHHLACQAWNGPRPFGYVACHGVCHNKLCYHGPHLRWGPPSENSADMWRDGTVMIGDRNHATKLTPEAVREIRRRYAAGGVKQWDLAREYGVRQAALSAIVRRVTWKHVD